MKFLHTRIHESKWIYLLPVDITEELADIQLGKDNRKKRENPNIKRFLEELRLTYCRFDTPTAAIIPDEK